MHTWSQIDVCASNFEVRAVRFWFWVVDFGFKVYWTDHGKVHNSAIKQMGGERESNDINGGGLELVAEGLGASVSSYYSALWQE